MKVDIIEGTTDRPGQVGDDDGKKDARRRDQGIQGVDEMKRRVREHLEGDVGKTEYRGGG
jgi:hypothetical protein